MVKVIYSVKVIVNMMLSIACVSFCRSLSWFHSDWLVSCAM